MSTQRRALFATLPAFAAMAPLAAGAFSLGAPRAGIAEDSTACSAQDTHAALQAELDRLFDGRPIPQALTAQIGALARCPFCGCGVTGAATRGDQASPRG